MPNFLDPLGGSASFGRLSWKAKILWCMMLSAADNQGRLPADARVLKWQAAANVDEITAGDIPDLLNEMSEEEMVYLYRAGRHFILQMVSWWEHNRSRTWAGRSRYPAPAGWTDRVRIHGAGNKPVTENWDKPGGFSTKALCRPYLEAIKGVTNSGVGVGVEIGVGSSSGRYVEPSYDDDPEPPEIVEPEPKPNDPPPEELEQEVQENPLLSAVTRICDSAGMIHTQLTDQELAGAVEEFPPGPPALDALAELLPKFACNLDPGKRLSAGDVYGFLSLLVDWPPGNVRGALDRAIARKACNLAYIRRTLEGRAEDAAKAAAAEPAESPPVIEPPWEALGIETREGFIAEFGEYAEKECRRWDEKQSSGGP